MDSSDPIQFRIRIESKSRKLLERTSLEVESVALTHLLGTNKK